MWIRLGLYGLKRVKIIFIILILFSNHLYATNSRRPGSKSVASVGDAVQIGLPVCAVGTILVYQDWEGALQFAKSFGANTIAVHIFKSMIYTVRPNGGLNSFPSGHTAAAFGGAAFMQMRYGWWFGTPAYLLAGYVGFSRVYARKHWLMDVLGGAIIALATNVLFTKPYIQEKAKVELEFDAHGAAIRLNWDL